MFSCVYFVLIAYLRLSLDGGGIFVVDFIIFLCSVASLEPDGQVLVIMSSTEDLIILGRQFCRWWKDCYILHSQGLVFVLLFIVPFLSISHHLKVRFHGRILQELSTQLRPMIEMLAEKLSS